MVQHARLFLFLSSGAMELEPERVAPRCLFCDFIHSPGVRKRRGVAHDSVATRDPNFPASARVRNRQRAMLGLSFRRLCRYSAPAASELLEEQRAKNAAEIRRRHSR